MKAYSQNDPKYKDLVFSPAKFRFSKYGCLITCLCMLCERPPDETLPILENNKCFTYEGLLLCYSAGKALNMPYLGANRTTDKLCIAETHYFKNKGFDQHFVVWLNDGMIIDPLDGEEKLNPYPIYSYRIFDLSKIKHNVAA